MRHTLQDIRNNRGGFAYLTELAWATQDLLGEHLIIDMGSVSWFNADMCAPLGALLYKISRNLNEVQLINLDPGIERILSKNGFLKSYGRGVVHDTHGTTISYERFDVSDGRFFTTYLDTNLLGKAFPQMTDELWKRFKESIYEIFANASVHSNTTQGIFACGQYYPTRQIIDFSIADLGIGIQQKLFTERGITLPAAEAIDWATSASNTTRKGSVPGGLGLKLLKDFVKMNGGKLQIVSGDGSWEFCSGEIRLHNFRRSFPGTVVNLEINTADTKSYCLVSEVSADDIF